MSQVWLDDLEAALQRHLDALYRLAWLLAPGHPEAAVTAMVRALVGQAGASPPDEPALVAALLATLPTERRPARLPAWARGRGPHQPLLAAVVRLPRAHRLALAQAVLHHHAPGSGDRTAELCDALLALARYVPGAPHAGALRGDTAPPACQPTRAALALHSPALQADPAIRGHLALCASCRAARQGWAGIMQAAQDAVHAAGPLLHAPPALISTIEAILQRARRQRPGPGWLRAPALLAAAAVLVLLGLWQALRPQTLAAPSRTLPALSPAAAPADLVRRAQAATFQQPAATGTWYGRWELQWAYTQGEPASLVAEQWLDLDRGRHRLQVTAPNQPMPLEFQLGDGQSQAWYLVNHTYASASTWLAFDDATPFRTTVRANSAQQQAMRAARLASGAWALAQTYLAQAAAAADLQSWSQRTDANGMVLDALAYEGISPIDALASMDDAPRVTILLLLDARNGELVEVQEFRSQADGTQTSQTVWRAHGWQQLHSPTEIGAVFDLNQALDTQVQSLDPRPLVDPALPLISPLQVTSPAAVVAAPWMWQWFRLPATPPPGAAQAMIIAPWNRAGQDAQPWPTAYQPSTIIYQGSSRMLALRIDDTATGFPTLVTAAPLTIGEFTGRLVSERSGRLRAALAVPRARTDSEAPPRQLLVEAIGYSRAELEAVLATLAPPSVPLLASQEGLFLEPRAQQPDARAALIGALRAEVIGTGQARVSIDRIRRRPFPNDPGLPDPYHLRPNAGVPPEVLVERVRAGNPGEPAYREAQTLRSGGGIVYQRTFDGPEHAWWYDMVRDQLLIVPSGIMDFFTNNGAGPRTALIMLACNAGELVTLPDGRRAVVHTESPWVSDPCMHGWYAILATEQRNATDLDFFSARGAPYMHGLGNQVLTTWIFLEANGRMHSVEVRTGTSTDGELVESWQREQEQRVLVTEIPPASLDAALPPALFTVDWTGGNNQRMATITMPLTSARERVPGTLFAPPEAQSLEFTFGDSTRSAFTAPNVFDGAVMSNVAIQTTYAFAASGENARIELYQGDAGAFGTYLRGYAEWTASQAEQLTLAGRAVPGWRVSYSGRDWLLAELDGWLVVVGGSGPPGALEAAAAALVPLP